MVYRMQLSFDEIMDVLDIKCFPPKRTRCTLPVGMYEVSDINLMLKSLLPNIVKINITIDNIRLKSNLKKNQNLIFTKRSIFCTILGFTQNHSGPLSDTEGFIHVIPGRYKNDKPNFFTVVDKVHLKADCISASIVNGVRERILYRFALDKPAGLKINKEARIKLFKNVNKFILSLCISASIVKGVRKPVLYRFALDKLPQHKLFKEPSSKFLKI